jgi:hypothetical protein
MKWLFLVHQVQTPNSRERVKVWRLTKKVGAILYRNSVYVLPFNKERLEDFQWLCQQIRDSKGEASVFVSESHDASENEALITQFQHARAAEYASLLNSAEQILARLQQSRSLSISAEVLKQLNKELNVLADSYQGIQRIDFFSNVLGKKAKDALSQIQSQMSALHSVARSADTIQSRSTSDFKNKTWATRKHIRIDRVCSAWLIRRFIDPKAKFVFAPEAKLPKNAIPFDVMGAEFGHHGQYCTFETLLHSFQLAHKALAEIAEIVHDIDLKDQKFKRPEAAGFDAIIRSLSDGFRNDRKTLEITTVLLDALYQRFSSQARAKDL